MNEALPGRGPRGNARERILEAAYELFSRQGTRAVGVDTIIDRAGVAKMTLYRHFPSKDDLAIDFLRRREELWTKKWLLAEVERRATTPGDRLLAIFDVFDEWFRREDFEGCPFISVLLEITNRASPVRQAAAARLAGTREYLRALAQQAGIADPEDFARRWHILMEGSIVAAIEGDQDAALRARRTGELLLAEERSRARSDV